MKPPGEAILQGDGNAGANHNGNVLVSPASSHESSAWNNAERAYRLLLESMNEGAVNVSRAGIILYCNARLAEMLASPPDRLLGTSLCQFVEASQQQRLLGLLRDLQPSGDKGEFTLTAGLGGRKALTVLFSLRPLELEGVPIISIVAIDLSAWKTHEEWLRRQNAELERRVTERTTELTRTNQELKNAQTKLTENARDLEKIIAERTLALEESVNSLEQFCYTIAHDLRAPLRTMHGFSSALLEDFSPSLDSTARDYATRIVRAATRMDDQIRALLTYGRLNSAEMPLTTTDLGTMLEQLRQTEEFKTAQILTAPPFPFVSANPTALRQILDNLIANGIKFVAPGVMPRIEISAQQTGGWVRISIQDNGIGIEPRYHQRIFRVFERVSTSHYPGTGIGLAIVQKGVDRMGGRVGVESTPGKGSRFWVDLLAARPAP
jgi:PAS domain S-box-containing protein